MKKTILNKQSAVLLLGLLTSASAFAATGGDSSLAIVGFLDQFADLMSGTIAQLIAGIVLVLSILAFVWSGRAEEAQGLLKTLGGAGLGVVALCGTGSYMSWLGYGALI